MVYIRIEKVSNRSKLIVCRTRRQDQVSRLHRIVAFSANIHHDASARNRCLGFDRRDPRVIDVLELEPAGVESQHIVVHAQLNACRRVEHGEQLRRSTVDLIQIVLLFDGDLVEQRIRVERGAAKSSDIHDLAQSRVGDELDAQIRATGEISADDFEQSTARFYAFLGLDGNYFGLNVS